MSNSRGHLCRPSPTQRYTDQLAHALRWIPSGQRRTQRRKKNHLISVHPHKKEEEWWPSPTRNVFFSASLSPSPKCARSWIVAMVASGGAKWGVSRKKRRNLTHMSIGHKNLPECAAKKKMLLILQNLLFGLPHGPFLAPPLMVARHSTQDECRFGSIVHTVRSSFSLEQLCHLRSDSAFREFQFSDNEGAYDSAQTKCLQLTRPVSSNVILSPSSCQSLDRLQFIIL